MVAFRTKDELRELLTKGCVQLENAFHTFRPRHDQHERFDQQASFLKSNTPGIAFLIGGNGAGCLGGEQLIYDPVRRRSTPVSEIGRPFHVWSRDPDGNSVIGEAACPRVYGEADLYEVALSNGRSFIVTGEHRVMAADQQWREIRELAVCAPLLASGVANDQNGRRARRRFSPTPSIQMNRFCQEECQSLSGTTDRRRTTVESSQTATSPAVAWQSRSDIEASALAELSLLWSLKCGSSLCRTAEGFQDRCCQCRRPCDERLPSQLGIYRESFPSQGDVLGHIPFALPLDGSAISRGCTHPCRSHDRLSRNDCETLVRRDHEGRCLHASRLCSRPSDLVGTHGQDAFANMPAIPQSRGCQLFLEGSCQLGTSREFDRLAKEKGLPLYRSGMGYSVNAAYITSIRFVRRDVYWDFSVAEHENYWLAGVWHHNTTECGMSKIAKYVLQKQPPPRKDTPFWIIAGSYEQVCETCWKEKLEGHGHLPKSEIDYDRIAWLKPNDNWPFRVPLKPWPGRPGRNWSLEFKSYKQGRAQMQSRSIGGFCFSEQFPWGLLTEVKARCREYNFPGGQFAEFTPIDPLLSYPLERMIEDDKVPAGWEIWRANTECAMEAGHVSREWYDEFFSMVPPSMRLTRQIGAWAVYEGAIYPQFADFHLLDDAEMFDEEGGFPKNVFHRRAIDWGSGPENAFCCLWAYKNGAGDWCYDGDMEVLTTDGWKRFDKVDGTETVGTADITGTSPCFEWQQPTHYHRRWFDGNMVVSGSEMGSVSFSVTPDHDMVLKKQFGDGNFVKRKAGNLPLSRNYRIPIQWEPNLADDADDSFTIGGITTTKGGFCGFLGLLISEGCILKRHKRRSPYSVSIAQKVLCSEVESILNGFSATWTKHAKKNRDGTFDYRIGNTNLAMALEGLGLGVSSQKKIIPKFLMTWGKSLHELIRGLEVGDGLHDDPRGQRQYFTTSLQLADDFSAVCARLGIPTKRCEQTQKTSFGGDVESTCYRVYIRKANGAVPAQLKLKREAKCDWVYCLTVPNGTLIVRRNGGTPFICGNCVYDEYYSTAPVSTVEHLVEIQERSELWDWRTNDPHFGATYADPSSPGDFRIAHNLSQYAPGQTGFDLSSASNAVLEGIEHVQWLLQPCAERMGKPRLFISKARCKNLIRELRTYRWKTGTDKADPQRQPLKKHDHAADALRYLTFSEARQGGVIPSSTDRLTSGRDYGVKLAERDGESARGIVGNFGRSRTPGGRT